MCQDSCVSERTKVAVPRPRRGTAVDIDAWTRQLEALGYEDDSSRAKAIEVHHSTVSRVRAGTQRPGAAFITGTLNLGIPFASCFIRGDRG